MRSFVFVGMLFCLSALANRTIVTPIPHFHEYSSSHDTSFKVTVHNPSTATFNFDLEVRATGSFAVSSRSSGEGYNQITCEAGGALCSMVNTSREIGPGQTRTLQFYTTRRISGNNIAVDSGVSMKIIVEGNDGYLVASGHTFSEVSNGVAYVGGPFEVNGGRPF